MPSESHPVQPQPAPELTPAVEQPRGPTWVRQAMFWVAVTVLLPLVLLFFSVVIGALGANEY